MHPRTPKPAKPPNTPPATLPPFPVVEDVVVEVVVEDVGGATQFTPLEQMFPGLQAWRSPLFVLPQHVQPAANTAHKLNLWTSVICFIKAE